MHHVIGFRQYIQDGVEKTGERFFDRKWRIPDLAEFLKDPKPFLAQVPEHERYNLFITLSHCPEQKGRRFESQDIIGFDIDDLDPAIDPNEYAKILCQTLGVEYGKTAIIMTGNGLHALIKVEPWNDPESFNAWRPYYKAWCDKLQRAFDENAKPCKVDPVFFSPGRMTRVPGTQNRKTPKGGEEKRTLVKRLQPNLEFQPFNLLNIKIEATTEIQELKSYPEPDTEAVLSGCEFLKFCFDSPADVREPEWYAALSIVGLLKDGENLAHKMSVGHPGYSQEETQKKLEQAITNSRPRTCKNIDTLWDGCKNCKHYQKIISPIVIREVKVTESELTGFYIYSPDGKKKVPDYEGLRKYFEYKYPYKVHEDSGEVLTWNGKYWERIYENRILSFAHAHFNPQPLDRQRRELLAQIKVTNLTPSEWFNDSVEGTMNFENGVLNLETMQLMTHSMDHGHRYVLDYSYDPLAQCPTFDRFMSDITCNRQELVDLLLEFMGFAISNHKCDPAKALVLVGEGANGKSTFIQILQDLVGDDAYSNVPVSSLNRENSRLALMGKLFNVSEETPKKALLEDSSDFKNLVSGGRTTARRLFHDESSFKNRAKFIFACNRLPGSYDTSHGMMRRLIIVPFENSFEGKTRDPHIVEKMKAERPGILNKVIRAYLNFKRRGDFVANEVVEAQLEQYKIENDPVRAWFFDQVELKPVYDNGKNSKDFKTKTDMFQSFRAYCLSQGIKSILNATTFFRELGPYIPKERVGRPYIGGKHGSRPTVVYGITLLDVEDPKGLAMHHTSRGEY